MNVTQLHGRVKTSIFSPPPSAAGFLGIWDLGSILVLSPGHSEPLLERVIIRKCEAALVNQGGMAVTNRYEITQT
jgi:hypothetical protein